MLQNAASPFQPSQNAILLSVKPRYAIQIIGGTKTVELRRRFPKSLAPNTLALIYASSPIKSVIGCVSIMRVSEIRVRTAWEAVGAKACVTRVEFDDYFHETDSGFAAHLVNPIEFPTLLSLRDLQAVFSISPPQSYRYLNDGGKELLDHGLTKALA